MSPLLTSRTYSAVPTRCSGEARTGPPVVRCPLHDHDERTPSFFVYSGERSWWCFGRGHDYRGCQHRHRRARRRRPNRLRKEAALPNENVNEDWVGYPDAERFSGLSRGTLQRLIANGQLRATKIGRVRRIDKHSLAAFIEHHPTQPKLPGFEEVDG